jgi:hypothetical protein
VTLFTERHMKYTWLAVIAWGLVLAGCDGSTGGPGVVGGNSVSLTASGGSSDGAVRLGKTAETGMTLATVDSLLVSDAVLVIKDIKFLPAPDTVHMRDSIECDRYYFMEAFWRHFWDSTMHFRGPFIVALRDTTPVQIALDTIAVGSYNGIRFKIHKLRTKDVQNNPLFPDSLLGYSIAVTGSIKYPDSTWVPFVFKTDIDEDFKVKGNFVVEEGQTLTPYVLKFDLASWFRSPSGRILDPNDPADRRGIRYAIKASLKARTGGGRDRNHDGRPDH